MIRTLMVLLLIATPICASAAEPSLRVVHPPWEAAARDALVGVETAWVDAVGVLVSERRVWASFGFLDTGRDFEVEHGARVSTATARTYDHDFANAYVLELERAIGGTPLTVSEVSDVAPGMHVYAFRDRGELAQAELVEVLVGSVSDTRFTLTAHPWMLLQGTPVLDADGRLLGLLNPALEVVPARVLADGEALRARGLSVLPLIGYRFGYEFGGVMDGAGTFDLELGVTLGDRVSLVGIFGLAFQSPTDALLRLPESDGMGPGRVDFDDSFGLRLGFEARYRQALTSGFFPLYLDLAIGFLSTSHYRTALGPVFRSTEPGCDPGLDVCPLTLESPPSLDPTHGIDMSFGADLRWGPMSLGYRFRPGIGDAPSAHHLMFGTSFF